MKVCVVTKIASPYQVEFFNALARYDDVSLDVIYVYSSDAERQWEVSRRFEHSCRTLHGKYAAPKSGILNWVGRADLVVFGWYRDSTVGELIRHRARSGDALCFWGERPGFRFGGLAGRLYRRWKLKPLLDTFAPVWGIGNWAIEGYQREFGSRRRYFNVPYFSDLERFRQFTNPDLRRGSGFLNLLYSGSLTYRKGVDLLAGTFCRLARKTRNVRLSVVGEGSLRPLMEKKLASMNDRVEFHGFQQWSDLPRYYHRADLLVAPSRHDGWGLVVLEGMAAGMPVIATNRMGSALEVISHGRNGWLIEAGDGRDLDRVVEEALALDRSQHDRMQAEAARSVHSFTIEAGVRRFRDAVASTLLAWQ